jgi:hypothetical protein
MAAIHKLKVKGTDYTIDQIVDQVRKQPQSDLNRPKSA